MAVSSLTQTYINKANEALSLALSAGLNAATKPSIDVQVLLDVLGGAATGTQQYNYVTVAYTRPAGIVGQLWLDANAASSTYKNFSLYDNGTWRVLTATDLKSAPVSQTLVANAVASAMVANPVPRILQALTQSHTYQRSNPTLAAADVPTIVGEIDTTKNPTTDVTDPVTKLVTISGDAATMAFSPNLALSAAQRTNALKYMSGYNRGMRMSWNYLGILGSNVAGGQVGDATNGNMGNNYDATTNPNGAQFPVNLNVGYNDFIVDSDIFYYRLNNNSNFQLYINDILCTVAPTTGANYATMTFNTSATDANAYRTFNGSNSWLKVKWSSAAKRNIRIVHINNTGPGDMYTRATGNIRPRFQSPRLTWLNIGDSFCAGSNYSMSQVAVAAKMAEYAGPYFDFVNDAQGGTGYNSGSSPFWSRLSTSLGVLQTPALITIIAGQNDTAAIITQYAPVFFAALRAKWPNAAIHVTLNYAPNSYAACAAKEAALIAACATVTNCAYVPSFTATGATPVAGQSWLTGSGNAGNIQNDGTADIYVGNDNVHPMIAGAKEVWADYFIRGIIANYMTGATY